MISIVSLFRTSLLARKQEEVREIGLGFVTFVPITSENSYPLEDLWYQNDHKVIFYVITDLDLIRDP